MGVRLNQHTSMKVLIVLAVLAYATGERIKGTYITPDYEAFKAKYNKNYSVADDDVHYSAYLNAVEYINNHNAEYDQGRATFWCGLNEYSDMTMAEREARNGFRPSSKHLVGEVRQGDITTAPEKVDWREEGYVNAVKDQGHCGSCWAFSAVCALEGQYFKKTGKLVDAAEQQLVSCDTWSSGCNGGFPGMSYNYISGNGDNGIDTQASYPYTATDSACDEQKTSDNQDVAATCTGYQSIGSTESALQEAVGNEGPVSICLAASADCFHHYSGGILDDDSCGHSVNHAVAAVGYDVAQNYWIVRNSWGTSWGEAGYVRIVKNKNMCGMLSQSALPNV